MALEIERKFLVTGDAWRAAPGTSFSQGYLNRDPARTVRVRIAGDRGFLTVKGRSSGATRAEFEYPVPREDAEALLALCDGPVVRKTRHVLTHAGHVWEIDAFLGDNAGLVVAEIELASEDEPFARPDWLGAEVTGDARYYNSSLAMRPFCTWTTDDGAAGAD
ncbi:CYTH domain-containing protein [uncultured Xylophilus sp.]|uniref:CYTH domain-containing protein n=1 Tax=uncultured Xylophilus sp. TaxID=296832 RepID=UPI0025D3F012|nr:CYTH domain-containing protein [uncultured Xylophilus sp.]